MNPFERRPLGKTSLRVTALGFGSATLGDNHGPIPEEQADATVEAAHGQGIAYFDTAPWYGVGKSEQRVGRVLSRHPRESIVLSTKVGRILTPFADSNLRDPRWPHGLANEVRFDYTGAGILQSYHDSLERLGLDRIDALLIHDLDAIYHSDEEGISRRFEELDSGLGYPALAELRESGEVGAIGAGINYVSLIPRFLERFELDFFLVAMPYTLLSQDGLDELESCSQRGISVVIGAPFASGILAVGPGPVATYGYRPADRTMTDRARRIAAVCKRFGVPLGAAALQMPLGHPAVASVIPGPNTPEQARTNVEWVRWPIPREMWGELKAAGLLRRETPTPA